MADKSFKCRVKFEGYDWKNILSIKSPTGNQINICCNGKWERMSPEFRGLATKYMSSHFKHYKWGHWYEETLSREIMEEALYWSINS